MSQQMAKRHGVLRVFALNLEIGQVIVDAIVELELARFHLLKQSDRGHCFERRPD